MGVPDHMLPHTPTVVRPASSTDDYGNAVLDYGDAATRTAIRAWMQQDQRTEPRTDGRDPLEQVWLMVTNHTDVTGTDRVEFDGLTFEVEGPPEKVSTALAGTHHLEATLRIFAG